ncbi:MAG: cytochrome c biogenesis CcdA family protein [Acidimicrobiales bacterium]|nr:cytochrome c biogenesis CcdA family protein [Acidimicrobiales bacterium]MDG2216989.1 cytochrome c biogenesis CcdA family protein [Acidimicrobiales bacterium]
MNLEQFAFPFSVGMLAAFNPCGFAMLPTYLGYFIGTDTPDSTRLKAVTRGLWVGTMLTVGFIAVFGSLGVLISLFLNTGTVIRYVGYITVLLGLLLIPMGIAMVLGRQITLSLPKLNKGTNSRESSSMFLFGVSYAVVSLSCTIGLFIQAVSNAFTTDGVWNGVGSFVAYAVGMGAVILFLTVSLARAKSNVAANMRRFLPHMSKVSGVVLVIAGFYLIDYGIWEIRILDNPRAGNVLVDKFLEFQGAVATWINNTTPERLGIVSVLGVALVLLLAWREDNPSEAAKRRSVTTVFALVCLSVELRNDWDFAALPLWRFATNWPARIINWFDDLIRWGVPLEALFVALVVWRVWALVDRYRRTNVSVTAGAS